MSELFVNLAQHRVPFVQFLVTSPQLRSDVMVCLLCCALQTPTKGSKDFQRLVEEAMTVGDASAFTSAPLLKPVM